MRTWRAVTELNYFHIGPLLKCESACHVNVILDDERTAFDRDTLQGRRVIEIDASCPSWHGEFASG